MRDRSKVRIFTWIEYHRNRGTGNEPTRLLVPGRGSSAIARNAGGSQHTGSGQLAAWLHEQL